MGRGNLRRYIRQAFGKGKNREIEPDEIFLDSSNLPQFDTYQFEGRIEKPISKRMHFFVGIVFLLIVMIYAGRVGYLQVAREDDFKNLSENNRLQHSIIFAERGVIYDRNGVELVWNEGGDEFAFRKYRSVPGMSHIVGYIGYPLKDSSGIYYRDSFIGKGGVERAFENRLQGNNGLRIVEVDAHQSMTSESVVRPSKNGENITLALDSRLESELYNLIATRARESGFVGGAGALMDIDTGEIIASVSYPEYDSQVLTDGSPQETIASYVTDSRTPFLDRIVSGLYTPGSIVKPFVAVGALREGIITPEKQILSTGSIRIQNPYYPDLFSVFRDWKAHGWVDLRHALAVSSDVYFYAVGGGFEDQEGLGIERINTYGRMFGFGKETGILFDSEQAGVIPTPEWKAEHFDGDEWRVGDTYNTAIGQYGFQVTPLQIVRAIAALANNGVLVTPTLEKGAIFEKIELPISKEILQIVREGMRLATLEGTATALSVPYVEVAGKTGTAELGARKQFVNSWVTGFFPYENPRYAFVVIMERGPVQNLVGASAVMRGFLDWLNQNTPEYLSENSN